jgi:hypothetical protein
MNLRMNTTVKEMKRLDPDRSGWSAVLAVARQPHRFE